MNVYISGPISLGDTLPPDQRQANIAMFHSAAAAILTHSDWKVFNPVIPLTDETGWTWQDYMRKALRMLAECQAIVMLPGWGKSVGARLELSVAAQLGLDVMNYWDLL